MRLENQIIAMKIVDSDEFDLAITSSSKSACKLLKKKKAPGPFQVLSLQLQEPKKYAGKSVIFRL